MPKRTNPFGECSPLQLKSHISKKDVDKADTQGMNSVYEKTKAILFEGSRKNISNFCENATLEDLHIPRLSPPHPLPGQLRLDAQGTICGKASLEDVKQQDNQLSMETGQDTGNPMLLPGQMVIDQSGKIQKIEQNRVTGNTPQCCTCNHSNAVSLGTCADCRKLTCIPCMQHCYMCEGNYCYFCTKPNSQDNMERPVCHQCAIQIGNE